MSVSWVLEADQPARVFERIVESNGGEFLGNFSVDCIAYVPQEKVTIQTTYILHHSKYPQTPAENFIKSPKSVCDRGFDLILGKMNAGCVPDVFAKFELNGNEYKLCDFTVRVGTATQGTTVKGVIIEVEYGPVCAAFLAKSILTEAVTSLFKQYAKQVPEIFERVDKIDQYTPLDTMWQFLTIFRNMRKKS